MAKPLLLPLTLCLLFLFHGSLARRNEHLQQQNQCQLDQIQAREPDNRVEAEAGSIESWNPNNDDLQCAGVAVERLTVEPNGLHLPSYSNAPQLIYIVKGNGVLGAVLPGCPETYEESQQQGQTSQEQQGQTSQEQQEQRSREEQEQRSREQERPRSREEEGQRSREQERHGSREHQGHRSQDDQSRFRELDRHQKVRHFREGDIIAIPAGVAYWTYNNGDSPFVAVTLLDSNNQENQLDQKPRRFYLAGNPDDEFEPQQQGRRQQSHRGEQSRQEQSRQEQGRQEQKGEHGQRRGEQERSEGNNIFSGFETRLLAEALNIDTETARKLQNQNDNRKNIVRVKGMLDFVSPARSREEREREEESERERKRERKHSGRDRPNGLEETFCSTRLIENIGDPSRADIYTPQAGRINSLNSFNLPILSHLRLSAERGVLYNDAIYAPNWNLNSHTIVYVIRGRARTQIVDENGNTLLDNEVRQGQLFVIPQNHAALSQAGNEGFEYIAFKTNENAQLATLAGKLSLFRALPESVITNAFQVSREQARKLKYNRKEATLLSSRRSSRSSEDDERRDVA